MAALRLFVRDGMGETTVRAIASEAGFTNPVLFKYFAGRDELAAFLFERCYRRFGSRLAAALEGDRRFKQKLSAAVDVFIGSIDEDLDAHLFVQENLRRMWPRVGPELRRVSIVRLARRLFEEGQAEGAVDARLEATLLATALLGTMGQVARAVYFGEIGRSGLLDTAAQVERLLANMVRRHR
jgi:AcrR family transcriptional regulator